MDQMETVKLFAEKKGKNTILCSLPASKEIQSAVVINIVLFWIL